MQKINDKIIKIISVPIAAQIAILPIMIKNFNTISFTFLISNIVAMPLLGVSIIGGYLLTIFSILWLWGAQQIGIIFNFILKGLMFIAKFFGDLKLSNIYVITSKTITIVIYYMIIITTIYFLLSNHNFMVGTKVAKRRGSTFLSKIWRKKILYPTRFGGLKMIIIILTIIIIIEIPYTNYNGKLKIYFIDVGQRRQYINSNSQRE